jgi:ParB-like nuclease domain
MNDETLALTKQEAVKRHVLGLKHMSGAGTSTKLLIAEITIGERLIPEDPKVVAQLVISMQQTRQLTPILVRQGSAGYTLIDGLNRIAALKQLGKAEVLASILEVTSELEARAFEAISNSHRRQRLTALDRALTDSAFVRYVALKVPRDAAPRGGRQPKEKFYAKAARELGVSPDQIARSCEIARIVPYVQDAVRKRKQEDNQKLLLEVAASGEDISAQIHTLMRLLGEVSEPTEEPWTNPISWPAHLGAEERAPIQSQSTSSDRSLKGSEASGGDAQPSSSSVDDMKQATREGGGTDKLARLAARNQPRRKSAGVPEANGEGQSGADQSDPKGPDEKGSDAKVDTQIQINIAPGLRAKLANLADGAAIRLMGFVRAPLGLQPSIEVQDITELREDENDWPE